MYPWTSWVARLSITLTKHSSNWIRMLTWTKILKHVRTQCLTSLMGLAPSPVNCTPELKTLTKRRIIGSTMITTPRTKSTLIQIRSETITKIWTRTCWTRSALALSTKMLNLWQKTNCTIIMQSIKTKWKNCTHRIDNKSCSMYVTRRMKWSDAFILKW